MRIGTSYICIHFSITQLACDYLALTLESRVGWQDQTILTTAVPTISDQFGALGDIGWYTAAYLVTTSTFQLAYGKLYSLFPTKIVYIAAIFVFEMGSIMCAAAPNSPVLIVGRAIAGLGAAGLFPGSTLILVHSAPLERRPAFLGVMTGMFGLSSLVGPFLGGAFTDAGYSTWRWCFIINVPLGAVALAVVSFVVKTPAAAGSNLSARAKIKELRIPEMTILVASLICLILALQWGGSVYAWSNCRVVALLCVFGVLLLAFVVSQIFRPNSRTISDSITKTWDVWFSVLFAAGSAGAMFVAVTYLPIYFQAVKGMSALTSSVNVIPLILGFLVFSIISGSATHIIRYYNPSMIIGPILSAVGAGLVSTLSVDSPSLECIGFQALLGSGIGFCLQQPLLVVQTVLRQDDVPFGVALMNLSQMLGGAMFVAVAQSVFQRRLASGFSSALPQVDAAKLLSNEGATSFRHFLTPDEVQLVLPEYVKALAATFHIAAGLCAAAILGALPTKWTKIGW